MTDPRARRCGPRVKEVSSPRMREVPKLPRRPEARAFSVEALLQLVMDGKLRVPEFQRPQRWRSTHVVSLFDSVWRGFPIGELLLARARVPAATLHFGPVRVPGSAMDDGLLIVDGQQRLTALAGALLHPELRPRGDIHAIWFDLEAEKFKRLERAEPPLHWIPLNVVGDSFKQLQWLNAWSLQRERPDLVQRALALGRALREFQSPAYIVEGASEAALRVIFKRVNTAGVAMREEEVFEALNGGTGRALSSACARLSELGFGPIRDKDVVAALKAVEDMDPRARFSQSETDLDVDPAAIERSEAALRRAIAFLVGVAGIPHVQLLPYRLPLRLLARFFHLHPEPEIRTLSLLVRWLWRGALSGAHGDDGDVVVAKLQACIGLDPDTAVTALLQTVPRAFDAPSLADRWNGRAARTRLCALAMFHRGPRDPDDELLDLAALQELFADREEIGEVFQICSDAGDDSIASRFLVASKSQLLHLLTIDGLFPASPEILASHGLDAATLVALTRGDHQDFLRRRAALFDPWMHQFFRERCAPDDSDRPAIATIVARTEAWTLRS